MDPTNDTMPAGVGTRRTPAGATAGDRTEPTDPALITQQTTPESDDHTPDERRPPPRIIPSEVMKRATALRDARSADENLEAAVTLLQLWQSKVGDDEFVVDRELMRPHQLSKPDPLAFLFVDFDCDVYLLHSISQVQLHDRNDDRNDDFFGFIGVTML